MVTTNDSPIGTRIARVIEMLKPVLKYVTPLELVECNHNLGIYMQPVRYAVIMRRRLDLGVISHNVVITREGRIGLTYGTFIETQLINRVWEVEMDEDRFLEGVERLLREAEAKKREDADTLGERADRIHELRNQFE